MLESPGEYPRPWEDEETIVWLLDPAEFRYVREVWTQISTRNGPPRSMARTMGVVVGYSTLRPMKRRQLYNRRAWWIAAVDGYGKRPPPGAVDPRTVLVGLPGRWTYYASGCDPSYTEACRTCEDGTMRPAEDGNGTPVLWCGTCPAMVFLQADGREPI